MGMTPSSEQHSAVIIVLKDLDWAYHEDECERKRIRQSHGVNDKNQITGPISNRDNSKV